MILSGNSGRGIRRFASAGDIWGTNKFNPIQPRDEPIIPIHHQVQVLVGIEAAGGGEVDEVGDRLPVQALESPEPKVPSPVSAAVEERPGTRDPGPETRCDEAEDAAVLEELAGVLSEGPELSVFAPHLATKVMGLVTVGPTEQLFPGVENQPL